MQKLANCIVKCLFVILVWTTISTCKNVNFIQLPLDTNTSYAVEIPVQPNPLDPNVKQFTKLVYINVISSGKSDNSINSTTNSQWCILPSNCADILCQGRVKSGVYTIYPKPWTTKESFSVYCDMETDGGGWLVFQRRGNYSVRENFFRSWYEYATGFGNLTQEFWLGNNQINFLTEQDQSVLRIDLMNATTNRSAVYQKFYVAPITESYQLTVENYTGDAGDSFGYHDSATFYTYDHDINNCANTYRGGWWYRSCYYANLNGLYLGGNHTSYGDGIEWYHWTGYYYSLLHTEMKMRPKLFKGCPTKQHR